MSLVRGIAVALALEDVTKMSTAIAAYNLRPLHAECAVCMPCHSAGDRIEECRPSAARLELLVAAIERRATTSTGVDALGWVVLIVLARKGSFGALLANNTELLYAP